MESAPSSPAKSDKASLYGQIVDAWQSTISDVGPAGLDKGAGGKYLWLANITNPKTRRAYRVDVAEFSGFTGLKENPPASGAKLSSLWSLFDYLCERNAVRVIQRMGSSGLPPTEMRAVPRL